MSLYGVGLNAEVNNINNQLKLHIAKQNGKVTINNLKQVFRNYDSEGTSRLDSELFEKALGAFGFFLKQIQYQTIFKFYDQERQGSVDYNEFVMALRQPLTERGLRLVLKVYDFLDPQQTGVVSHADLQKNFNSPNTPHYLTGKISTEQYFNDFLSNFEKDSIGQITRHEFVSFYEDLAVAIPSESQFCELLSTTWGVVEDEQSIVSESEVKNIVKILRYKLIQTTTGISDEFLLKKLFQEFDTNKSGYLTLDELYAMTIKLEIPIHRNYLSALFKKFDRNGSNHIDFDEFLYFITYDPYP